MQKEKIKKNNHINIVIFRAIKLSPTILRSRNLKIYTSKFVLETISKNYSNRCK